MTQDNAKTATGAPDLVSGALSREIEDMRALLAAGAPRILSEEQARAYLGGKLNPGAVMAPVRLGGRNVWDRIALDAKLDEIFGVVRPQDAREESPLNRWRKGRGLGSENAA